jgi:hypothetical protein
MSQHLINRGPNLAECNRCSQYVLAGLQNGCRYAVEPTPLNPATYRALTLAGVHVWHIQGRTFSDHACGCSAIDTAAFEEAPPTPPSAPVRRGNSEAGPHHAPALATQGPTSSVAQPANPRHSDVIRCAHCDTIMQPEDHKFMVEMPVWQENTIKVPNRGQRKGWTRTYQGWGCTRWAIHSDGCPADTPAKQT